MELTDLPVIRKQGDHYVNVRSNKIVERPVQFLNRAPMFVPVHRFAEEKGNLSESLVGSCLREIPQGTNAILIGDRSQTQHQDIYLAIYCRFADVQ